MTENLQFELIPPKSASLNQVSAAVPLNEISSTNTQQLITAMLAIANGTQGGKQAKTMVGLAAPQLGVNKRIIIVDVTSTGMGETLELRVYINPVITARAAQTERGREGCFSTGNVCGAVERASAVTVEAYDQDGHPVKDQPTGFTARIFQHEVDHLDGIRFPDRITVASDLHWVEDDQFGDYREHWQTWQQRCPRPTWEAVKGDTGE